MAADNSLSPWADSDLVEMEKIGSDDDLAILVQIDKPNIGARRLFIAPYQIYNLGELGVIDMCDWHTLYEFLKWGVINYPAANYLVVLWDHATGWTLKSGRSFGSDWSSGTEMSVADGELKNGLKGFYNTRGEKIEILAFDACLMQEMEVAFETKDYARIQVAPQTLWPLPGFPYDEVLSLIKENPGIGEVELAKRITGVCKDCYLNTESFAISAINLEKMAEFKNEMVKTLDKIMAGLPDARIKNLRNEVQTISLSGSHPQITDDYVDLGDFLRLLNDHISCKEADDLYRIYKETIITHHYLGDFFPRTSGLTTWFPDQYLEFKQLLDYYLGLDYTQTKWVNFLNWFYDEDDLRPGDVKLSVGAVGGDNDFRIFWSSAFDLAQINYGVIECCDTVVVFNDPCEDSVNWILSGFQLNHEKFHSGNASLFSGNSSNLNNFARTKGTINLETYGLLDLYLDYLTEDMTDSFIIEFGNFKEVYYGNSKGWINLRIILPPGNFPLKFSYRTNAVVNNGGVYVDDIKFYKLKNSKYIRSNLPDTTIYIFNKLKGDYLFAVQAIDRYGNRGSLSNFGFASIKEYAVPYSIPSPFFKDCEIVLDYPDSIKPFVYIYSISGRLIKRFNDFEFQNGKRIYWDGRDEKNREVGSGLYFVLIKGDGFNKIGKIVRQR